MYLPVPHSFVLSHEALIAGFINPKKTQKDYYYSKDLYVHLLTTFLNYMPSYIMSDLHVKQ